MALLDSEIARIKAELGVTVVGIGAEPYIGITRLFENIIQQYTTGGATTTRPTSVTALSSRASAGLVVDARGRHGLRCGRSSGGRRRLGQEIAQRRRETSQALR